MTLPRWNDPNLKTGTMVRTALWLLAKVGVGNSFTKEQHRNAFVGIAQADRRLRDLRKFGWVIHTNLEDLTLNSNEQRFVKAGAAVWDRSSRSRASVDTVSAKQRKAAFAASGYQCSACGIAPGEKYADAPVTAAVLSASRRVIKHLDGKLEKVLVCECNRCLAGKHEDDPDLRALQANLSKLSNADQRLFRQWMEKGRTSVLDRAWAEFRRLPPSAQEKFRKKFAGKR